MSQIFQTVARPVITPSAPAERVDDLFASTGVGFIETPVRPVPEPPPGTGNPGGAEMPMMSSSDPDRSSGGGLKWRRVAVVVALVLLMGIGLWIKGGYDRRIANNAEAVQTAKTEAEQRLNAEISELQATGMLQRLTVSGLSDMQDLLVHGDLTVEGGSNLMGGLSVVGDTNVSGSVVVTGTIAAANLSGNGASVVNVDALTLQGQPRSFYTNASNISSGTLSDSWLSTNVAFLTANQTFSGLNTFLQGLSLQGALTGTSASFSQPVAGVAAVNVNELVTLGQLTSVSAGNYFLQDGNSYGGLATLGTNDAFALAFETGGSERVRIGTNGNVGIGTTAPGGKLDIITGAGFEIYFSGATSANIYQSVTSPLFINSNTGDIYVGANGSGSQQLTVKSSGNVGVGTTAPGASLEISKGASYGHLKLSGAQIPQIYLKTTTVGANQRNWDIVTNQTVFGDFIIRESTTNSDDPSVARLYINYNGNVGIGTATPETKLHVSGGHILLDNGYYLEGKDTAGTVRNILGMGSDNRTLLVSGTAGFAVRNSAQSADFLTVIGSGNVGIGITSPGNLLDIGTTSVGQGLSVTSGGTNLGGLTRQLVGATVLLSLDGSLSGGTRPIHVGGAINTNVILANAGGNVGIGTTTPLSTLHTLSAETTATNLVVAQFMKTSTTPGNSGSTILRIGNNGSPTIRSLELEYNDMGGGSFRYGTYGDANIISTSNSSGGAYGNINFVTGNAATHSIAMTIGGGTQKGNVGIGETAPGAKLQVNTGAAGTIGQIIKGAASQTGDLQQWQTSTGSTRALINSSGRFAVSGGTTASVLSSATVSVINGSATDQGLIIKGAASQSADLLQAQDSTGAVLAKITAGGNLEVKNATINGTLTVNGHIITANTSGSTTVAANTAVCGTGCTVTISGNDTSGIITVNTGTGVTAGTLGTVTFAGAYGAAPRVVLTPETVPGSATFPQYHYGSGTTTFDLKSYNALTASVTYTFSYQVMQ